MSQAEVQAFRAIVTVGAAHVLTSSVLRPAAPDSTKQNVATMLLILVVVAALIVIAAGIVAGRTGGPAARRWADWLRWAAFATAAVAAAMLAPVVARDSRWFATVLLGVPVVLAALPVGLARITGRAWSGIDWLAAILAMAWAVLLALGIGVAFLPAALLQLAAAATASGRTAALGQAK